MLVWVPPLIDVFTVTPNNVGELSRLLTTTTDGHPIGWFRALGHWMTQLVPVQQWTTPRGSEPVITEAAKQLAPPPVGVLPVALGLVVVTVAGFVLVANRRILLDTRLKRSRLPGLVLIAGLTCIPMVWTATHVVDPYRLAYINLLLAAPFCLSAAVVWYACRMVRQLNPVPGARLRVPGLAAGALAVLMLLGYFVVPSDGVIGGIGGGQDDWKRARTVADAVTKASAHVDAVRIDSQGPASLASVGPAVSAALQADGHEVFFDTAWQRAQDDDFRRLKSAPSDAETVLLREQFNGKWFGPATAPPGARWIAHFPLNFLGYQGTLQVLVYAAGSPR